MRISTAQRMVQKLYAEALKTPGIKDPVAWALYRTWTHAEADRQKNEEEQRKKEELKKC